MFGVDSLVEYGPLGLFIVAFLESTVFPIPPDLILIPLCMTAPRLSFWYAFLTTFASVLGGVCGYFAGQRAGRPLVDRLSSPRMVDDVERLFVRYGGWAVGVAAFTPIPFKVFTFGAGIFRVPFWTFVTAAFFGRAGRFFLEGSAVFFLGERARQFLGHDFEIVTLALTVVVFLLIALAPRLPKVGTVKRALSNLNRSANSAFHNVAKDPGARSLATRLVITVIIVLFTVAFLEDAAGPEVLALNRSLGLLTMGLGAIIVPLGPLWRFLWSSVWMVSYAAFALIWATVARVLSMRSRKDRQSRAQQILHWSLRAGAAALLICLIHASVLRFLANDYRGLFQPPNANVILSSLNTGCGAAFFAVGLRPPARAAVYLAAGLTCAGMAAFAAHTGILEPAAAGSLFLVSVVTLCLVLTVLSPDGPRS